MWAGPGGNRKSLARTRARNGRMPGAAVGVSHGPEMYGKRQRSEVER